MGDYSLNSTLVFIGTLIFFQVAGFQGGGIKSFLSRFQISKAYPQRFPMLYLEIVFCAVQVQSVYKYPLTALA